MPEQAPPSPDGLKIRGAPLTSARLSKKAAFTAIAVLAAILGVIIVNVSREKPKKAAEETKKDLQPALNAANSLTRDVPDVEPAPKPVQPPVLPATAASVKKNSADDARLADTAVPKFSKEESAEVVPAVAGYSSTAPSQGENTNSPPSRPTNSLRGGSGEEPAAGEPDLNRQDEKLTFLSKTRQSTYLNGRLEAPVSPFELKTGTVIPGILVSALSSDLPGEIIAQVSQNVYDSASGNHLLIPQGTRIFGHYDSQVSFGQSRVLVVWQRLIYPNAATLELGGMSGHDESGNAGFADQVNNHYGRIFGWGLVTSILSAGYQLSQPQQNNLLVPPSNQQVAAAAVGQQMAQLGAEIARRNMQVQPSIEIRKGYRLNVMVNKDVVFPGSYSP